MTDYRFSHAVGFDDAPFDRGSRDPVQVVGTVFAGDRLDGVLSGTVARDGADATAELVRLVATSRFYPQLQLVFLQGIAFAGFNIVDVRLLYHALNLPAVIVARRAPDLAAMERALTAKVPEGARKWRTIQRTGAMESVAGIHLQRAGLSAAEAEAAVRRWALRGSIPEPLRVAHLVAGGLGDGHSRGRA
ncbi:endonuclease dU [Thiohalorhabdus sp.]|uniref:endonuclease dU n=1 Tax=Thiohalorhabdus sp. TaxID=3094134 RepID=UPI002FC2CCEB